MVSKIMKPIELQARRYALFKRQFKLSTFRGIAKWRSDPSTKGRFKNINGSTWLNILPTEIVFILKQRTLTQLKLARFLTFLLHNEQIYDLRISRLLIFTFFGWPEYNHRSWDKWSDFRSYLVHNYAISHGDYPDILRGDYSRIIFDFLNYRSKKLFTLKVKPLAVNPGRTLRYRPNKRLLIPDINKPGTYKVFTKIKNPYLKK